MKFEESHREESKLAEAIGEFLELQRAGKAPPISEFVEQHPAFRGELQSCLGLLSDVRSAAADAGGPPHVLGDFQLLRLIGRGGMGLVYEAQQRSLPRRVALKVLPLGGEQAKERIARFRREVEATARLQHPNIVPVYETGQAGGFHYYAMPLLQGRSLHEVLRECREDPSSVLFTNREDLVQWVQRFISVGDALESAHRVGIIHRDIKPSNLFLDVSGRLLVVDFGLTRSTSEEAVTLTGELVGTPRYMSPEQILPGKLELDGRTDVFSVAATLYEVLTLRPAFPGQDRESTFRAILARDPTPLRKLDARVPRDLEVVVLKALEKEPKRRYQTMREFVDDLQRFLDYAPVRARPVGPLGRLRRRARRNPVAAGAVALAVLALAGASASLALEARRSASARREETARLTRAEMAEARSGRERLAEKRGLLPKLEAAVLLEEAAVKPSPPFWSTQQGVSSRQDLEVCRQEYEELSWKTLSHLFTALQLSPEDGAVRRELSAFVYEEYCAAERRRDRDRMMSFRPLVEAYGDAEVRREWEGSGSIAIQSHPPGADVFLFRFEKKEFRLIPVPYSPARGLDLPSLESMNTRGPWVYLRVSEVDAAGSSLRTGDDILMVCGTPPYGVKAVVDHLRLRQPHPPAGMVDHVVALRREGRFESVSIPPSPELSLDGECVAERAAPLRCEAGNLIGQTPLAPVPLEMGSYLALLRREGFPDVRLPFEIARREHERIEVALFTADVIGADFVYIPAGPAVLGGDRSAVLTSPLREVEIPAYFIQRFETRFMDYLEFIRDLDRTDRSLAEKHAPRSRERKLWVRGADGTIQPKLEPFDPAWPLFGVSFPDAQAYCCWLASKSGDPKITFDLPTEDEWEKAGRGTDGRYFTWGNDFEWTFARLGRSAHLVTPLPGGLYPADESVYGVSDLGGNIREWCQGAEGESFRVVRGGGWGYVVPAYCRLADRTQRRMPDEVDTAIGFRVVKRLRTGP